MTEVEYEEEHQIIAEQYKIWRKHVPFLYWSASTYQLPTCTQTVEWLKQFNVEENKQNHYCIVGTNSTASNKIMMLKIEMPTNDTLCDNRQFKYNAKVGQFGLKKIIVQKEIERESEINKARLRHEFKLLAVKCGGSPLVSIVNLDDTKSQQTELILQGHMAEGMGLQWNPLSNNLIASGSSDRRICVWDIQASPQQNGNIKPITQYVFHSSGVQDVSWNHANPNILASCSQDKLIAIWDLREKKKKPQSQKSAHSSDVFSVKFSPFSETLLLSAGQDSQVNLWDTRYFSKRIHTFSGHVQGVNCIKWSPTNRTQFVSGSSDRSIIMWNIQNAGSQNQISFIHGGHRSKVLDIDLNINLSNTILSSEQCNLLQVWCPSESAIHNNKNQAKMEIQEQNE